jgi:hypothetical protein
VSRLRLVFNEDGDVDPIFFFLLNKTIFSLNVNFDVSSSKISGEFSLSSAGIIFSVFERCFP